MKSKTFPPSRTFVYDKTSLEFVEQRRYLRQRLLHFRISSFLCCDSFDDIIVGTYCRDELNTYWQEITSIDKVTDFRKHHSSPDIKSFLDFDLFVGSTEVIDRPKHRLADLPFRQMIYFHLFPYYEPAYNFL